MEDTPLQQQNKKKKREAQDKVNKRMSKLNSTLFSDVNRIQRCDNLKFHCEVRGYGTDVHRNFVGAYYPRWRALYLDEARPILGGIKLFPAFPFDVYTKSNGENFFTADFVPGQSFVLGDPQNERDVAARTFFITSVDTSQLTVSTAGTLPAAGSRKGGDNGAADDLLKIRDGLIRQAGGAPEMGLKAFGRFFRDVDSSGRRCVTKAALEKAAAQAEVSLSSSRLDAIIASFQPNSEGAIDYEAVMEILRGPLSLRRQAAVRDLFRKLDFDGDGVLKLRELAARFNPSTSPWVLDGTFTAAQMQRVFMTSTWDKSAQHAGIVSSAEFFDYYNGMGALAESDDIFESTLKSSWKLV
jgi:Ca2+-binding EF-hand superfamily protein